MHQIDPACPVLVGLGQNTWRDLDVTRTPVDALAEVAAAALADTGVTGISKAVDCVATVRFIADTNPDVAAFFPRDPGAALARRLALTGTDVVQGAIGGNSPQYMVNQLASKLAGGEYSVVLLAGAELLSTFFGALKTGGDVSGWADGASFAGSRLGKDRDGLNETEMLHGLYEPIITYPLFENALRHHEKRGLDAHRRYMGDICSAFSRVAARNPLAWRRKELTSGEITTVGDNNRMIAYPYTKLMSAFLSVDMAAAIVMTTAGRARDLGIDEQRLVYLRAGVDIDEIWNISSRESLHRSPGLGKAARAALEHSHMDLSDIDCFDIYSCFPSAVEIACKEIGISPLDPRGVTVTGGLPYFGGPGNNYSLHAIAEMVSRLREKEADNGLITANGLYLTKHSVGVYSSRPATGKWTAFDNKPLQSAINQGTHIHLDDGHEGKVSIETYTVAHDRDGPKQGYIVARNQSGHRVLANTGPNMDTLSRLLAEDPIGKKGYVGKENGKTVFRF
ncbi:acetyl-CoA acetyltransferase [Parahaliea mediterranea]|uniref:Acetyl-CoA acetyltransferase n=1 Tax=Parahaliea mediterranea TaxID=651086 RepID=A0A939DG22_9GAMM|nr:acetyl-CoA acetyltransferase [Parahaliea mediterranea]MBN7797603.1 acetyl-CoA acetyltransferase [Parahaliea mediterranea]